MQATLPFRTYLPTVSVLWYSATRRPAEGNRGNDGARRFRGFACRWKLEQGPQRSAAVLGWCGRRRDAWGQLLAEVRSTNKVQSRLRQGRLPESSSSSSSFGTLCLDGRYSKLMAADPVVDEGDTRREGISGLQCGADGLARRTGLRHTRGQGKQRGHPQPKSRDEGTSYRAEGDCVDRYVPTM